MRAAPEAGQASIEYAGLLALVSAVLAGAGAAAPVLVEVVADDYEPGTVRVTVGATVRWINRDGVTHTVSAFAGPFDSGPLRAGEVFAHTFDQSGAYQYGCDLHLEMLGRVVVTED
jgi:plastocyanin